MLRFLEFMVRKITYFFLGIAFAIVIGLCIYYYFTTHLNGIMQNLINNLANI